VFEERKILESNTEESLKEKTIRSTFGEPYSTDFRVGGSAYVMINCESGFESSTIDELKKIDGVKEVEGTFGNYDILAKIEAPSIESLRDIITFKIRKIANITSTTTLVCADGEVECLSCGFERAIVYYDERYHGLRSRCTRCDADYPES